MSATSAMDGLITPTLIFVGLLLLVRMLWPRRSVPLLEGGASRAAALVRSVGGDRGFVPPWWLRSGHAQTLLYGSDLLNEPVEWCEEEVWRTADGGTLGIVWPQCDELADDATVVIILHGLGGDARKQGSAVSAVRAAGLRAACFQYGRGTGWLPLTSARFNLFGSTHDLRECVQRVRARWPRAPLAFIASSAGTGLLVRYLGEEGEQAKRDGTVAAVAISPGYDLGVAMTRCSSIYDGAHYVSSLRKKLGLGPADEPAQPSAARDTDLLRAADPAAYRRCAKARQLHELLWAAAPYAGDGWDFATYLRECNPMGVVHQIAVTSLVLNAEDDPITVIENKDDWPGLCEQMADACMLRLPMGGHVGFFEQGTSWKPRSWAFGLAAAFVAAARDEKPSLRAGERKGRQRSSPSRRKTA